MPSTLLLTSTSKVPPECCPGCPDCRSTAAANDVTALAGSLTDSTLAQVALTAALAVPSSPPPPFGRALREHFQFADGWINLNHGRLPSLPLAVLVPG